MGPLLAIAAGALFAILTTRLKAERLPSPQTSAAPLTVKSNPSALIVRRKRLAAVGLFGLGAGLLSLGAPLAKLIALSFWISALRASMLLSTVLHDRRPRLQARNRHWPAVSVVIPAHNEEKSIAACIRSIAIAANGLGGIQILVVDDGSSDGTLAEAITAAAEYPFVEICAHQPNRGKVATLNRALAMATGEIVVTVDADTTLHPAALAAIVGPLVDDASVVAVAGKVVVGNRGSLVTDWQAIEYLATYHSDRLWQDTLGCIITVPGAFGAWRTSVLHAHEGFSAATLAEDTDLTLTVGLKGGRIVYAPDALAYTLAPDTWHGLFRQRTRWLRGNLQSGIDHLPEWPTAPPGYALMGLPEFAWKHTVGPALVPIGVAGLLRISTLTGVLLGLYSLDLVPLAISWQWSGGRWRDLVQLPFQRVGFLLMTSTAFVNVAAQVLLRRPTRWSGFPPGIDTPAIETSYFVWPHDDHGATMLETPAASDGKPAALTETRVGVAQ